MSNVFDLYSKRSRGEPRGENSNHSQEQKVEYSACLLTSDGQRPARLALYFRNGTIQMPSYAKLIDVIVFSHESFSLIFEHVVINVRGEYLFEAVDHLQYERAELLGCFDETHPNWIRPKTSYPIIYDMEHEMLDEFYLRHKRGQTSIGGVPKE